MLDEAAAWIGMHVCTFLQTIGATRFYWSCRLDPVSAGYLVAFFIIFLLIIERSEMSIPAIQMSIPAIQLPKRSKKLTTLFFNFESHTWQTTGDPKKDAVYVGKTYNDVFPDGQGTYTFPDGRKYVGEWKNGKYHGQGTYTFPNGKKYIGEFKDDKMHGQGIYTFPDGKQYVGKFEDNKPWNGTAYDKGGYFIRTISNGVWKAR